MTVPETVGTAVCKMDAASVLSVFMIQGENPPDHQSVNVKLQLASKCSEAGVECYKPIMASDLTRESGRSS